jgi:hypothetical protein
MGLVWIAPHNILVSLATALRRDQAPAYCPFSPQQQRYLIANNFQKRYFSCLYIVQQQNIQFVLFRPLQMLAARWVKRVTADRGTRTAVADLNDPASSQTIDPDEGPSPLQPNAVARLMIVLRCSA